MFWINILFWAAVVISITIDSKKPTFTYGYKAKTFEDYVISSNYEYALYYILDSIRMRNWHIEEMISTFNCKCARSIHLRDRLFGYLTVPIAKYAIKKTEKVNTLFNISVLIGCCCYNTLKGGSKNYHRRYVDLRWTNVLPSLGLFSVQSVSAFGHNARIAPALTYTLPTKTDSKYAKANF